MRLKSGESLSTFISIDNQPVLYGYVPYSGNVKKAYVIKDMTVYLFE